MNFTKVLTTISIAAMLSLTAMQAEARYATTSTSTAARTTTTSTTAMRSSTTNMAMNSAMMAAIVTAGTAAQDYKSEYGEFPDTIGELRKHDSVDKDSPLMNDGWKIENEVLINNEPSKEALENIDDQFIKEAGNDKKVVMPLEKAAQIESENESAKMFVFFMLSIFAVLVFASGIMIFRM